MKITDQIIAKIIFAACAFAATASTSLGAEPVRANQEAFAKLEVAVQTAKDQIAKSSKTKTTGWPELEAFQGTLWRSMALDPSIIAAVPPSQVPKSLFSAELTEDLTNQFEALKKSTRAHDLHADAEFSQYVQTVQKIVDQRNNRQFPQARATAKRGLLDNAFTPLLKKVSHTETEGLAIPAMDQIDSSMHELRDTLDADSDGTTVKELLPKKAVFMNGNRFIWYAIITMVGFFLGVFGYRMHPDFFQKVLDQIDTPAPTATTQALGANQLDYVRWLRELEEILSRLKSSQMTHERRIEDIVQNSEKISQHSLSLYADPRIKNEANLDFRMSILLRDAQHAFEQSQKLQAGDRVQINYMLEHCLKLCDAVESNSVYFDRTKTSEMTTQEQQARSA